MLDLFDEAHFWSRVDRRGPDECWLWLGTIGSGGYGRYGSGSMYHPHRVAYTLVVGPIPEGLTLDHLCRVRRCVNPAHLEAVTIRENVLRGDGPTAKHARATHCPQGHEYTPENTRFRGKKGRDCRACRRLFNHRPTPCSNCGALITRSALDRHQQREALR